MSVNKVILLGNTGDDIKIHYFEGGGCLGRLPIATNSSYTSKKTGEKVTETEWHACVFRNKTAEVIEKFVKKGDQIYVEGAIKTRKWKDESGTDRYSTEVHVLNFSFVGNKSEGGSAPKQNSAAPKPQAADAISPEEEDDLPF